MSRLPRLAHKGPIMQAIYLHSYTPLKREWVNPLGANINFLLTTSIQCQEIKL